MAEVRRPSSSRTRVAEYDANEHGSTRVVKTDIAASNGTIHVSNKVLLPPAR
jgi:uncharacterized surface protein with fasciclin (FAS1) repeats